MSPYYLHQRVSSIFINSLEIFTQRTFSIQTRRLFSHFRILFLFDSSLTSLPFNLPAGSRSSRKKTILRSWGQHNNFISPFFHVPWTWYAGTLCCPGKKQTERNPPVFTPFPPFRPNRREKQRCRVFSSLKSRICISRGTVRNFLRIGENHPFIHPEFINPFERKGF